MKGIGKNSRKEHFGWIRKKAKISIILQAVAIVFFPIQRLDFSPFSSKTSPNICRIIFRLYFYSCKLLYSTLYGAVYLGPQDAALFPLLGLMLTMIFCMNIYWFNFIVRMVVRVVLTGEDPEDNREFDTTAVSGIDKGELDKLAKKDR